MTWRAKTVRRRLGIPREELLRAWTMADHRGMQVPAPPLDPVRPWPAVVALTDGALWVSRSGATRRYDLEDVVMASLAGQPDGALRVDFMTGGPLVVMVRDGGDFYDRVVHAVRGVDRQLQMEAPVALGLPDLSARTVAAHGTDRGTVQRFPDGVSDVLHGAQVIALRELRSALRASLTPAREGRRG